MKLGAIYTNKKTTFKVKSTADKVVLKDYTNSKEYEMKKQLNGIHVLTLEGNLNGMQYNYLAYFNNDVQEAVDPYANAVSVNGKRSVVVNLKRTNPRNFKRMTSFENPLDAVIYELHVRDYTIDENLKSKYRGKFLALVEPKNLKYLKSLGITHLQLLPIFDYSENSVDETNILEKYNWGYDPVNYNAVEGSYSTDP